MGLTLATEMDWQIFLLQRKYLDYQVNIGNRIIATLQSGEPDAAEKAQALSQPKKDFQDIMDSLFAETGKKIIRTENEIKFTQIGETLLPYQPPAARSRSSSSCSPCSWRIRRTMCSSWTSPR